MVCDLRKHRRNGWSTIRVWHPKHARFARFDRELRAPYNPASKRNLTLPPLGEGRSPVILENAL